MTRDQEKNLKRLKILIQNTDQSVLMFCLYNTYSDVEDTARELNTLLSEPVQLEHLNATGNLNPLRPLRTAPREPRKVFFLVYQGDLGEDMRQCAGYAQVQREALLDVPHVAMLWFTEAAYTQFIERAPDFWSWRSGGTFDFATQSQTQPVPTTPQPILPEYYDAEQEQALQEYMVELEGIKNKPETIQTARLYYTIAYTLDKLFRYEEAIDYTKKALIIAEKKVKGSEFHGSILHNLGYYYDKAGHRPEALNATLKAVDIRRKLAQSNPRAFHSDLAMSLTNLGDDYSKMGQREEALNATREGLKLYRILAAENPRAFNPNLATSLNNLGAMYSEMGQREEALNAIREAVEIRRTLVTENPKAFNPDLARSLNNLGNVYSAMGQREEALDVTREAVERYRTLAAENPRAFNPDLALSLTGLGVMYSEMGQREEALTTTREAVEMHRTLAAENPRAFNPDLAGSVDNLGIWYSELGQREDALIATREAVDIRRTLAAETPRAFNPVLARSLNNLGAMYSDLGMLSEAEEVSRESIKITRALTKENTVHLVDLGCYLETLARILYQASKYNEALILSQENLEILKPYYLQYPNVYKEWWQEGIETYTNICQALDITPNLEYTEL